MVSAPNVIALEWTNKIGIWTFKAKSLCLPHQTHNSYKVFTYQIGFI